LPFCDWGKAHFDEYKFCLLCPLSFVRSCYPELRDLRGVIEREKTVGGVRILVTNRPKAMIAEAKSAGQVKKKNLCPPSTDCKL